MFDIDARLDLTSVMQDHAGRYWSNLLFVENPVNRYRPARKLYVSIAVAIRCSLPNVARCFKSAVLNDKVFGNVQSSLIVPMNVSRLFAWLGRMGNHRTAPAHAGQDYIPRNRLTLAAMMTDQEANGNASDQSFFRATFRGGLCGLTAATLANTYGDDRLGSHFRVLSCSATAGDVPPSPGFSLPQLYHFGGAK